MSNYKMQIIFSNIEELENYIDLVDAKVLEPYKTDIMRLPQADQKADWYKYTLINNLITQSRETVSLLTEQVNTMHSQQEMKDCKQYIAALKKYIRDLGGNPSIVNYILKTDL